MAPATRKEARKIEEWRSKRKLGRKKLEEKEKNKGKEKVGDFPSKLYILLPLKNISGLEVTGPTIELLYPAVLFYLEKL